MGSFRVHAEERRFQSNVYRQRVDGRRSQDRSRRTQRLRMSLGLKIPNPKPEPSIDNRSSRGVQDNSSAATVSGPAWQQPWRSSSSTATAGTGCSEKGKADAPRVRNKEHCAQSTGSAVRTSEGFKCAREEFGVTRLVRHQIAGVNVNCWEACFQAGPCHRKKTAELLAP